MSTMKKQAKTKMIVTEVEDGDVTDVSLSNTDEKMKDQKGPEKALVVANQKPRIIQTLLRGMGKAGKGGGKYITQGIKIILTQRLTQRSAAASAYTTVVSLAPSNSTEWTGWSNEFDEMICDKIVFKYTVTTAGVVFNDNVFGAMAYDPLNAGVLSSVANVMESAQSVMFPFVSGTGASSAQGTTDTKMRSFVMKVPKGRSARTTAVATNVSGEWSATSDTSDTYGFMKPFFEPGPSLGITSVCGMLFFHCRFRSRT